MIYQEFSLINRYFDRIKKKSYFNVEIGIGDDCALLNIPKKQMLAISTDTLVSGQHFFPDINPADLAYKALMVNISDLAAMGATPAWLILALTLKEVNENWLKSFSDSLFEQLHQYNIQLIGGDTTSGPLSITMTIHGLVPIGQAIKRSGTRPGDQIYVTGTLGDSAVGLLILKNQIKIENTNDKAYFIERHLRPTPRIFHGQALRRYASSAIDLSDGLISDLKHILKVNKVGARINLDAIPISTAMRRRIDSQQILRLSVSGGEDYELFFTVPKFYCNSLNTELNHLNPPFTCIGEILSKKEGLQFLQNGVLVALDWKGYNHFS